MGGINLNVLELFQREGSKEDLWVVAMRRETILELEQPQILICAVPNFYLLLSHLYKFWFILFHMSAQYIFSLFLCVSHSPQHSPVLWEHKALLKLRSYLPKSDSHFIPASLFVWIVIAFDKGVHAFCQPGCDCSSCSGI